MRLFASDFDGTLYFGPLKKDSFKENVKSIQNFQKENAFAIVTGRDYHTVYKDVQEENLHPDYYACFSGALILDKDGNILHEEKLHIDVKQLEKAMEKYKIRHFAIMGHHQTYHKPMKTTLRQKILSYKANKKWYHPIHHMKDLDFNDIYSCSVGFLSEMEARECAKELEKEYDCSFYVNKNCIDIVSKQAGKKKAVDWLMKTGQYEKAYVIGDSYNDLEMIQAYQGFTLTCASEEIQKRAFKVVRSVSEAVCYVMQQK